MNEIIHDSGRETAAINTCIDRISGLVKIAIPDATVEVVNDDAAGGRVDLLARLMGKPLGQSFVLRNECLRAWDDDPGRCRSIDPVAFHWISVLKIKMADTRSWRRVSSKLRKEQQRQASA